MNDKQLRSILQRVLKEARKELTRPYPQERGICALMEMMYVRGTIAGEERLSATIEVRNHIPAKRHYLCAPCQWEPRVHFLEHLVESLA